MWSIYQVSQYDVANSSGVYVMKQPPPSETKQAFSLTSYSSKLFKEFILIK